MFRAELTFLTAEACGLSVAQAESLACATEYFHAASLLFDDLSFMDNASVRRGEICAHLLHGEGAVTLAALALITRAYALVGAAIARAPANRQEPAVALVERCLGTRGMLNGQARDLRFEANLNGARDVMAIALGKTVPLIHLALLLPAVLGGLGAAKRRTLRRLGVYWGLFYQGVDDLKDVLATTTASGKSSNQDQRLDRPNIAGQLGLEHTRRYLRRLEQIAHRCITKLGASDPKFIFLRCYHRLLSIRLEQLPTSRP